MSELKKYLRNGKNYSKNSDGSELVRQELIL